MASPMHGVERPPMVPAIQEETKGATGTGRNWTIQKITDFARNLFKYMGMSAISIGLYLINPPVFTLGFLVGLFWHEQAKEAIGKIVLIWKTQNWGFLFFGGVVVIGLGSFFSLPVSIAAASFIWAAHLGSMLTYRAQEKQRELMNQGLEQHLG